MGLERPLTLPLFPGEREMELYPRGAEKHSRIPLLHAEGGWVWG
jgi:hypothetical protein